MGKPNTSSADIALRALEGTFGAAGQSGSITLDGEFNITLTGTAVAAVQLEKSFDGGTTWCAIFAGGTQLYQWSYSSSNFSETAEELEAGVRYRLNCTSCSSGTLNYRISQ